MCGAIACLAVTASYAIHGDSAVVPSVVSGRAGLKTTSTGAHERWASSAVTITIDPSVTAIDPAAKDAVMSAFGAWAAIDAHLPALTFDASTTRGHVAQDGVNRLVVAPITVPGHERDVAITISYVDAKTGDILEADAIYNSNYAFGVLGASTGRAGDEGDEGDESASCAQRYDLQNVATHEAGHFFGLGEDYDDETTTMYVRSSPCETHKRALTATDVSVIASLYPAGSTGATGSTTASHGCAGHARIARGRATNGALVATAALAIVAAARRRRRA